MLTVRRDTRGFLEVKEELFGFTDTKTTYWYYDTERWLVSRFGKKDEEPCHAMIQRQIDWIKTYYLPQLKG